MSTSCALLLQAGAQTPAPAAQTGAAGNTSAAPAAQTVTSAPPSQPATSSPTPGASIGAQQVQTGGTRLHGTITDPDGELIPGAQITLTPAHGRAVTAKSGSDGTYAVSVSPGTYTLLVSMPGFASYSVLNLKVNAVPGMTLDAKLKIGEQEQVVNVDASALQLSVDQDSNASSTILTGKDLDALSDDPDELSSELTALAGPAAGPNGGQIYVDGFTGGQLPPKSSIREIRINQNPFSAEYDKLGYGRVEVFTKPGTDKIHGSFQINGNPSQFNSANPLDAGVYQPPYHTIFMFGSLTGPISKGASYNIGGSHRDIEDDEFTNARILAPAAGSTALCAPGAAAACVISQSQTLTYYPQVRTDINPRLDLALGDKNVLTMRYQFVVNDGTNAGIGNLALPSAGYNSSALSNIVQISDTQTVSSKIINESRFEYEREHTKTTALSNAPSINVEDSFTGGGSGGQNATDHQDHYEVQNYTSVQLKKNFLRLGGRLRTTREAQDSSGNANGTFLYSSLTTPNGVTAGSSADNSYQTGTPSEFTFTQYLHPHIDYTFADLGLYAETDWKPRPNLTISYGVRYETQNHLSDHHDIAPRTSFAYGLGKTKSGSPFTVIRGGFGLFYDRFGQGQIQQLVRQGQNTNVETQYTLESGQIPLGCSPGAANLATACLSTGAGATTATTYSTSPSLRTPYIVEFAGGADQQLGKFGTMSVNYLHSQGVHQLASQNAYYGLASSQIDYQYFSEGVFNQNQLIVNGRVQTTKWLSLFGYYSLNSAHGDTSGAGAFLTTPHNIAADYGRTTFDVRNRLFMAGSVTLPKYIQLSPFIIAQSGNPYNITTGSDNNGDTIFNDRPVITTIPANGTTVKSIAGCGTFAQPGTAGAGTTVAPINACTGPALFTFNFRLTKTFGFGPLNASAAAAAAAGGSGSHGSHGGGAPGGGGGHGSGGGGPMFGGGGSSTGRRYNLAVGLQVQNLFNNNDLATPNGTLSSSLFGQSTQVAGGPYTSNSALRRISLQASFNF